MQDDKHNFKNELSWKQQALKLLEKSENPERLITMKKFLSIESPLNMYSKLEKKRPQSLRTTSRTWVSEISKASNVWRKKKTNVKSMTSVWRCSWKRILAKLSIRWANKPRKCSLNERNWFSRESNLPIKISKCSASKMQFPQSEILTTKWRRDYLVKTISFFNFTDSY